LEARGFGYINYTQLLKRLSVNALRAIGIDAKLEDLEGKDKEKYRKFIIETGTVRGFDQGWGIDEIVLPQLETTGVRDVVFDNVRFPAQFEKLQGAGFRLVRITTPGDVRVERAKAKGLTAEQFFAKLLDPTEQELPRYPGEIELVVDGDMDQVLTDLSCLIYEQMEREAA
jgi:hypothetical protein